MNKTITTEQENDFYKVICPFFKGLHGSVIDCEGLIPGTNSTTNFGRKNALKRHRNAYCDTFAFGKCELCKALLKKYDEPGRR
ncbi:MAG: hypothetical protein E7660_05445 [Ruminococcaceae bacterium]|nr:hypothetical protein [Oscillospiraceae bacterium]